MLPWRQYAEASGAKSNLNTVTKLSHQSDRMRGFYELLGPYAQRKNLAVTPRRSLTSEIITKQIIEWDST
jgi:hypothetical protein